MDETLRAEAGEQALDDPLLKVQVDRVLGEHARVLEDNRADRRLAAPVGELLVLRARYPERIERRGPARVGFCALVERREVPDVTAVLVGGLGEWLGAEDLKGATERFAKRCDLEARPRARLLEETAAVFDLRLEILLAIARRFELFLGDALPLLVKVCLLDLPHEALGIAVADTLTQPALDVVIDHLREAAELLTDGLGLLDEHLEDPVLDTLGQHEVVTPNFGRGLEFAIDPAVALLDPTGVPGEVEVKEVRAVRLEVEPLAGGVGGK